jgi:hypothetical protein
LSLELGCSRQEPRAFQDTKVSGSAAICWLASGARAPGLFGAGRGVGTHLGCGGPPDLSRGRVERGPHGAPCFGMTCLANGSSSEGLLPATTGGHHFQMAASIQARQEVCGLKSGWGKSTSAIGTSRWGPEALQGADGPRLMSLGMGRPQGCLILPGGGLPPRVQGS